MKDELLYDAVSGRFFKTNYEKIDEVCKDADSKFREMLKDRAYVTLAETLDYIYEQLGLPVPSGYSNMLDENGDLVDPYEYGWSYKNMEGHNLSFEEKHPCGCPYCGRSW